MIHKHEFGAEAIAYLTVRLAEFGSFGRLLAQHFTDNLSSFCYLPDGFEEKEKPVCFLQDLVVSTTEERRMMERRDAEFLHSFLAAKPNRGINRETRFLYDHGLQLWKVFEPYWT